MAKNDNLKKHLENFLFLNKNLGRKQFFDIFFKLGAPKSSLNRWITRLEISENLDCVTGSVGPIKIATIANINRIKPKIQSSKWLLLKKSGQTA